MVENLFSGWVKHCLVLNFINGLSNFWCPELRNWLMSHCRKCRYETISQSNTVKGRIEWWCCFENTKAPIGRHNLCDTGDRQTILENVGRGEGRVTIWIRSTDVVVFEKAEISQVKLRCGRLILFSRYHSIQIQKKLLSASMCSEPEVIELLSYGSRKIFVQNRVGLEFRLRC